MRRRHETLTGAMRDLYFARIASGASDQAALGHATREVVSAAERWHLEPSALVLMPETLEVAVRA